MVELMDKLLLREGHLTLAGKMKIPSIPCIILVTALISYILFVIPYQHRDPIFEPVEGEGKTYAEMSKEDKNKISHRGRSFAKFKTFLLENQVE